MDDPTPTPEEQPPKNEHLKKKHPNWGGRRPGAGAPRGNMNNYRDGRYSRYQQEIARTMAQIPALSNAMIAIARRNRKRKRQVEEGAEVLMAEVFRRIGEALVDPNFNHLESNQDLIAAVREVQRAFSEFSAGQSSFTGGQSSPLDKP